jgi:glutamate/tyrosine decarboxylase-like PLP-dependent enzyme
MITLPKEGTAWPELRERLREAGRRDVDWRDGRLPMFIHYAGDDVLDVAKQAFLMYFSENGLGLRVFDSLRRFETEVVSMGLGLLHGTADARGTMSTGGTESIFLAVKAARDAFRKKRPDCAEPVMVLPRSAHPAFDKAAHFMSLRTVRVPLRADYTADPEAMAAAITPDTMMLVGSVPAYPHGVIDPITELGAKALAHDVWLHVDACVGGYLAPFVAQLEPLPAWDFAVPGVRSISADLHKYGYAAKGASTVFFRDAESFAGTGWQFDNWSRGAYATNTLVGTRAGGAIAAAWAVMNYLGEEGYRRIAQRVIHTRQVLQQGLAELGLPTYGNPRLSIFAFGSPQRDIAALGKGLTERGWVVGYVTEPPGIHHMLNLTHEPVAGRYLSDVADVLRDLPMRSNGGMVDARY